MVSAILECASLIIVSIVGGLFTLETRKNNKDRQRTESRAKIRHRESLLSMNMHHASIKLGVLTAKALTNQKINGDVKEAMEEAEKAKHDYEDFLKEMAAEKVVRI